MKDKIEFKGRNELGNFVNAPVFIGNFYVITDFTVVEDMDPYLDEGMGDVIVGEPFCKASCVEARRFDGIITIRDGDDNVTYQMVRANPRFKHLTNEKCNKIPPLLKTSILEWAVDKNGHLRIKGTSSSSGQQELYQNRYYEYNKPKFCSLFGKGTILDNMLLCCVPDTAYGSHPIHRIPEKLALAVEIDLTWSRGFVSVELGRLPNPLSCKNLLVCPICISKVLIEAPWFLIVASVEARISLFMFEFSSCLVADFAINLVSDSSRLGLRLGYEEFPLFHW
ncbi:hypothetical protein Tco_0133838 [Tanacetum coccineum]